MEHEHREARTCRCSMQALEPADDCPVHGWERYPKQCEVCGQFFKEKQTI